MQLIQRRLKTSGILLLALALAGCGDILGWLSGAYDGPRPNREPLSSETVIVRATPARPDDWLLLDRVRYLEGGEPHNVNRVIYAITSDVRAQLESLNLHAGDRLVVSTRFVEIHNTGDLRQVPDWPGHDYFEYPIALHSLTSIARATP